MAIFNKFDSFVDCLSIGYISFATQGFAFMLTNTAPVRTNRYYSDLQSKELPAGNGYSTGGLNTYIGRTSIAGTTYVIGNQVQFTSTGVMGPFRYAVMYVRVNYFYNKDLVGWFDYGSSITLQVNERFIINSARNGDWSVEAPLLTIQ